MNFAVPLPSGWREGFGGCWSCMASCQAEAVLYCSLTPIPVVSLGRRSTSGSLLHLTSDMVPHVRYGFHCKSVQKTIADRSASSATNTNTEISSGPQSPTVVSMRTSPHRICLCRPSSHAAHQPYLLNPENPSSQPRTARASKLQFESCDSKRGLIADQALTQPVVKKLLNHLNHGSENCP